MDANGKIARRFGSLRVFVVYLICFIIIFISMLLSIIFSCVAGTHTIEKMVEHIFLCLLAILFLSIPIVMQARFKFKIPTLLNATVAIFIVAHCVLGEIYRFYDYIFLFDKVLHATAGVIIAVLGFSIVYGFSQTDSGAVKLSPFFVALFSFCFAIALLTLWEIFEYGMDALFGTNMQRWKDGVQQIEDGTTQIIINSAQGSGLIDTMSDLIIGAVGALIISIVGSMWVAKNPKNTMFYVIKHKENHPNEQ